jgi:hypothetical protein
MTSSSYRPLVAAFFNNTSDAENAIHELRDRGFTSSQIGTSLESENETALEPENEMGLFSEAGAGPAEIIHQQGGQRDRRSFWEKMKDFFSGESEDFGTRANERKQVTDNAFGAIRVEGYNIPERFHSHLASGAYVTVESSRVAEAEEILARNHGVLDHDFAIGIRETIADPNSAIRRIQILSAVLRVDRTRKAETDTKRNDRKIA